MIGALILAVAAVAGEGNLCVLCHPDVRVQYENSIHHKEGVTCDACHGGSPKAATVGEAHRGNFRGVPRRKEIPALCASCHSDIERMRPYNLPTDQMALYQTSRHGTLLAKGDERTAVCSDCHGAHDVLRPEDPRSRVFVTNIPRTCATCHSDAALMGRYGLTGDPTEEFTQGVHGRALLAEGNFTAPDCARCHGAHGALPPGFGDINKVCGQCHTNTRDAFRESPHRDAMREAGLAECVSCHDHHRIERADLSLLETVCLNCHGEDSEEAGLAATIRTLITGASERLDHAATSVGRAAAVPIYVEDYRARLEEARTMLTEALPLVHTLDAGRVEALATRARSIGDEVESEIGGKLEELQWRRVWLMVFWFYLLLTVAILVRFRRRAAREAAGPPGPQAPGAREAEGGPAG